MKIKGKHAVITGTSSGIGRAIAKELLRKKAVVTSMERSRHTCDWTSITTDVTDEAQVRKAFAQISDPVDILVCNAGVMRRGSICESSAEDFDALMSVNIKGVWLTVKEALPHLAEHAVIVLMSSRHGYSLPADPALYGLSKRFVMDMGEVLAKTYPQHTVKVLCPGPVDTPLSKVGTDKTQWLKKTKMMCTAEDLAKKAVKMMATEDKSLLLFDQKSFTYSME